MFVFLPVQAHQYIIGMLVDLIGITSIMEVRYFLLFLFSSLLLVLNPNFFPLQVLIRLIGADEHLYANYTDVMQWLEGTDVLEMIVDKFSSSVSNLRNLNFFTVLVKPLLSFEDLWRTKQIVLA